jgi:Ca2+-binding RTX toxin-like protein
VSAGRIIWKCSGRALRTQGDKPRLIRRALTLAVGVAAAFAACGTAQASTIIPTCTLAGGQLVITPPAGLPIAELIRAGDSIAVQGDDDQPDVPLQCAGGNPTVLNTDRISFAGEVSLLSIDFHKGLFAPGKTDEGDGTSEIEFYLPPVDELFIFGTDAPDHWTFGSLPAGLGVNFNADEPAPDIDLYAPASTSPAVGSERGDDLLTALGQPGVTSPYAGGVDLNGHQGNDVLLGGPGPDTLNGNNGRNYMDAGPGNDLLLGDLGGRDRIRCGPGHDSAIVDHRDRVRGCERVSRHRRLPLASRLTAARLSSAVLPAN